MQERLSTPQSQLPVIGKQQLSKTNDLAILSTRYAHNVILLHYVSPPQQIVIDNQLSMHSNPLISLQSRNSIYDSVQSVSSVDTGIKINSISSKKRLIACIFQFKQYHGLDRIANGEALPLV